jgi:hypothetical protein
MIELELPDGRTLFPFIRDDARSSSFSSSEQQHRHLAAAAAVAANRAGSHHFFVGMVLDIIIFDLFPNDVRMK